MSNIQFVYTIKCIICINPNCQKRDNHNQFLKKHQIRTANGQNYLLVDTIQRTIKLGFV